MSEITKQKGASSSTPSAFSRWFSSKLMNHISSPKRQARIRAKREAKRLKQGRAHVIEYFHQVDDGYSHLAIQLLSRLASQYDVELIMHLVPRVIDDNFPEPDLWRQMSLADAKRIAPYYGLEFTGDNTLPKSELVDMAAGILAKLSSVQQLSAAAEVSTCLWRKDKSALEALARQYGCLSAAEISTVYQSGNARRQQLKHFNSAMFYYEGEWYWGVDRFYHLAQRLTDLRLAKDSSATMIAPRPKIATDFGGNMQRLTLEFYVSLRSPYTAIAWDPTIQLAKDSGVSLIVKPVLPMVMRGVPATREKKIYIATDVAREAKAMHVEYGNFYDPVGDPVLKGYSLYLWAEQQQKGDDFLAVFLKAAFAWGVNCNTSKGLQRVVEAADLDWQDAKNHLHDDGWQPMLENNRLTMYQFGCWGVPCYRLINDHGETLLTAWGQDRIWLIAAKLKELNESKN